MKPAILALLSILILSACVTTGKMAGVREGMTKTEVINTAGDPDGSGDHDGGGAGLGPVPRGKGSSAGPDQGAALPVGKENIYEHVRRTACGFNPRPDG